MINRKYFAGFIDSDGSIQIRARKLADGNFTIQASVSIKQLSFRDKPLRILAEAFDLNLYHSEEDYKWSPTTTLLVNGSKAVRILEQIKNHLVIKQRIAEFVLSIEGKVVNQDQLKVYKSILKDLRNTDEPINRSKVSSAWMAGYIDGDGCLRAQVKGNSLSTKLEVTTYIKDTAGIELLKRQFGGSINKHGTKALRWVVYLTESNVQKILSPIVKHSLVKRDQIEYVIGFLKNGKHLPKKGATVESLLQFKNNLSEMKQPHRLSD